MKSYVFIFALLLAGYAFAFTVNVPEGTVFMSVGESKQVDIPFFSNVAEDISITLLDTRSWMTQSVSMLEMEPGVGKVFTLSMEPPPGAENKVPYVVTLAAKSLKTGEEQRKPIYISVSKIDVVDVEKMTINGNFTPNGNVIINGLIKNYKSNIVENVRVITTINSPSSKVVEFEQPISSIDPGETQNLTYNFGLPKYAEAGLYTVNMTVVAEGETREKVRSFSVARKADFTIEISRQPGIFGFRKVITAINIGNQPDDVTISDTLSSIDAAFFYGEEPVSKVNNQFYWLLKNVQPGETRRFVYNIDYSPAVLFVAVVLIASWVFFFRFRTLRIKKYILERKFIEMGEEFTVGVELINTSGSKIESSTVKDFVPSVFEIKDVEGPKPIRRRVAVGTELTWHVKDLHKNEERILSYKIIPMFGIHGTIRLPRASVKYHAGKKENERKSFYASIGIEMENYKDKKEKK